MLFPVSIISTLCVLFYMFCRFASGVVTYIYLYLYLCISSTHGSVPPLSARQTTFEAKCTIYYEGGSGSSRLACSGRTKFSSPIDLRPCVNPFWTRYFRNIVEDFHEIRVEKSTLFRAFQRRVPSSKSGCLNMDLR